VLTVIPDGVVIADFDLRIRWANPAFETWCNGPPIGRGIYEALGAPALQGSEFCPFHTALAALPPSGTPPAPDNVGPSVAARIQTAGNRWIDLTVTPFRPAGGFGPLLVAVGRDVTAVLQQQQQRDALHKAGRELAALMPDQLAEMSIAERV